MLGRAALPLLATAKRWGHDEELDAWPSGTPHLATATRGRHGGSCPSPYFSRSTWYTTNAGQTRDFNTARRTSQKVPE